MAEVKAWGGSVELNDSQPGWGMCIKLERGAAGGVRASLLSGTAALRELCSVDARLVRVGQQIQREIIASGTDTVVYEQAPQYDGRLSVFRRAGPHAMDDLPADALEAAADLLGMFGVGWEYTPASGELATSSGRLMGTASLQPLVRRRPDMSAPPVARSFPLVGPLMSLALMAGGLRAAVAMQAYPDGCDL